MPASTPSKTPPPFPTRFPPPPRLALSRRRWVSDEADEADRSAIVASPSADAERLAHQIELALALRERAVADAESRLADRVRDLDELDALLRAREALLAAARLRDPAKTGVVTLREAEALTQLRNELDRQEITLRETRQALVEREQFIEQSETQLFAKVQLQQERETELEQREENLRSRETRFVAMLNGEALAQPPPRVYDEFRE